MHYINRCNGNISTALRYLKIFEFNDAQEFTYVISIYLI